MLLYITIARGLLTLSPLRTVGERFTFYEITDDAAVGERNSLGRVAPDDLR